MTSTPRTAISTPDFSLPPTCNITATAASIISRNERHASAVSIEARWSQRASMNQAGMPARVRASYELEKLQIERPKTAKSRHKPAVTPAAILSERISCLRSSPPLSISLSAMKPSSGIETSATTNIDETVRNLL